MDHQRSSHVSLISHSVLYKCLWEGKGRPYWPEQKDLCNEVSNLSLKLKWRPVTQRLPVVSKEDLGVATHWWPKKPQIKGSQPPSLPWPFQGPPTQCGCLGSLLVLMPGSCLDPESPAAWIPPPSPRYGIGENFSPPRSGFISYPGFCGLSLSTKEEKNLPQSSFLEEKEFTSLIQRML